MMYIGRVLEATGLYHPAAGIVVESWVKNCTATFYNHSIGMRSYLPKNNFQFNLQKHHFVYVYEVLIKCYLNFITCLHFLLPLITWNSNHCHQMVQTIIEKLHGRMILEGNLFLRLSVGFVWKILSFVGKHLSFYAKDVCSSSVIFISYLNEKESNQQVFPIKCTF